MVKCPFCNQNFLYNEIVIGCEARMVEGDEDRSIHYIYSCPKCDKLLNCTSGGFE